MGWKKYFLFGLICITLCNCKQQAEKEQTKTVIAKVQEPLFSLLPPERTGIHFENILKESLNANVLVYEYLYNGGGVAVGDLNGDGLQDLYFTSNMGENKLYLNQDELNFKDITDHAAVNGRQGPWKTGVSIADVNGDGLDDIYLCYSGALPPEKRANQLFVNQGNDKQGIPVFKEMAQEYGLASTGFSNQAYFFDYDHDGDLDMLLLNHNPKSLPVLNEVRSEQMMREDDALRGLRLLQQGENHRFTDVTIAAGVVGSPLAYGLGLGISDVDGDGWEDFYVSNDYAVPDYLYKNNGDGTFSNTIGGALGHTSHFSMGNDIADINNDGLADIVTLDMLPEDNKRQKLLLAPDNYEKHDLHVRSGFHHQYMRNMLQLNNGNGSFSEIGQLAGISNTDWSWAALLMDYDNDGWKDLFVTNGYFRDYTNLDFIDYMESYVYQKGRLKREEVLEIIEEMPSSQVSNYLFRNKDGIQFTNETTTFGLEHLANSNGAAYADLDNDGDMELVVNNINQPAFVYENTSREKEAHNFLQLVFSGENGNTHGIGVKARVYHQDQIQQMELFRSRGYLSSVEPMLHFGLGTLAEIDSLEVRWPSGKTELRYEIKANQRLLFKEEDARVAPGDGVEHKTFFESVPTPIAHKDATDTRNDFKRQSLLLYAPSKTGPCMVKGDVNGDGLEDVFVGGAYGQPARVYLQTSDRKFTVKANADFQKDAQSHDTSAAFLDANDDGHLDLYVASGGYHDFKSEDARLQDRLYFGNGDGTFTRSPQGLPNRWETSSVVRANDIDEDGDIDLFVGGGVVPGRYPTVSQSVLLLNDGTGVFSEASQDWTGLGMVKDALWADLDQDGISELIVVGEWMPVTIFKKQQEELHEATDQFFAKAEKGWWSAISVEDVNADGYPDLLVGNMGDNAQFQATEAEPLELFYDDFDSNGSIDPIFTYYIQGVRYPYLTRGEILGQLAYLRAKFTNYEGYADATLEDVFSEDQLEAAKHLEAHTTQTTLYLGSASGKFHKKDLPKEVQYAPVYSFVSGDFNGDGHLDFLLFGNHSYYKLRLGKFDANYGQLLIGDGTGDFKYVDQLVTGLKVKGDVRSTLLLDETLLLGINQAEMQAYRINQGVKY